MPSLHPVPLARGGHIALDHDGSSGHKAPLQSRLIWHRLWEENMVSQHLSGPQKPGAGTNFQRGNVSNPRPLPTLNPTPPSPHPPTSCPTHSLPLPALLPTFPGLPAVQDPLPTFSSRFPANCPSQSPKHPQDTLPG